MVEDASRRCSQMRLLSVRDLEVRAGENGRSVLVVDELAVHRGEILGIVGPPGSGKSTLALSIAAMLPLGLQIAHGRIEFDDRDLLTLADRDLNDVRGRRIGLIFQSPDAALDQLRSCRVQLEEPLRAHATTRPEDRLTLLMAKIQSLGFSDPARVLEARPSELSGGERQRILMALATLLEPELLIADEPTSGLDPALQQDFVSWLKERSRVGGGSAILISHQWELVRSTADRILRLEDGRLLSATLPEALPALPPVSAAKGEPLLVAEGLSVSRGGTRVLTDVSLELRRGEALGVLGPSGAGKTTLARALAGLLPLESGRVRPDPLLRRTGEPSPIQLVFQDPSTSLNPRLAVGPAIAEAALFHEDGKASAAERARGWLARVGLGAELFGRLPETLSGGQQQLAAIARALAAGPAVIIADEPTASLSPEAALRLVMLMRELVREASIGLILISHDRDLIASLCPRAIVMAKGRVVRSGAIEAIFEEERRLR